MGNSSPLPRKKQFIVRRLSSQRRYDRAEVIAKILQKEYVILEMQSDIKGAILTNDVKRMECIMSQIVEHMIDLEQLKAKDLVTEDKQRCQKALYYLELSLAKLKSINNSDTITKAQKEDNLEGPDLVSDVSEPSTSRNCVNGDSLCISGIENENLETELTLIQSEFNVLEDQVQEPIIDIHEYYEIDAKIFDLYLKLRSLRMPNDSVLQNIQISLENEFVDLRDLLQKKIEKIQEEVDITEQVKLLKILLSSEPKSELGNLKSRALLLQETIQKSIWSKDEDKIQLLKDIEMLLLNIECEMNPSPCAQSVPNSPNEEGHSNQSASTLTTDCSKRNQKDQSDEIYSNVNMLIKHGTNVQDISSRFTLYANEDVVSKNKSPTENWPIANKRPLPLPRNYNKIISSLSKHWRRLNDLLEKETLSEIEQLEVKEIRSDAEIAKKLFEEKIQEVMEKYDVFNI